MADSMLVLKVEAGEECKYSMLCHFCGYYYLDECPAKNRSSLLNSEEGVVT